jgi:16S rRNA (uracil1498-N3)-methyltransferase
MPKGAAARIEGAEAHHLSRVLRKTTGETIELFDGNGQFALAEILGISKKSVDLKILESAQSPPPVGEVILATAAPKGERFRWLVEKAVELGVDRLIPLITLRSVVKPGEGKREKMEQAVIEACKQSRRNRLMTIEGPKSWESFLNEHLAPGENSLALLAHPGGSAVREVFPASFPQRLILIVGPEGGFAEEEVSHATRAGAIAVTLGSNILRIETACLALAGFAAIQRPAG